MKGSFSSAVVWLFVLILPFAFAPPAQAQGMPGVCVALCDDPTPPTVYNPPTPQGRYTTPRGVGWYCKAKAPNGGWGWGESSSKSEAIGIAIEECGSQNRGCSISYCTLNGGARKKSRTGTGLQFKKKRRGSVSATVCYRKLIADVRSGSGSARLNTYISQALAGYANCKRKAFGSTRQGDNYARKLRNQLKRGSFTTRKKSRSPKRRTTLRTSTPQTTAAQRKALLKKRAQTRKRTARLAKAARLKRQRAELAAAPGRVAAAVKRGDYKAALTDQALVLAANKKDPGAWRDFSTYLEKSGRLDDAATAIRRAALLAGNNPSAAIAAMYQRDAIAKGKKGDFTKAIAQQAMAVAAKKDDPDLWRALADYMEKAGQLDNAATALWRAKILGGPDPEEQIFQMYQTDVLARAVPLAGEEKIALYQSHIEKFADVRGNPVRHRLARELLRQQRVNEARQVYQRIASLDPRDNTAQAALAPSRTRAAAPSTTLSQLQAMRRDMEIAAIDLTSPTATQSRSVARPASGETKLGTDIDALAGTLSDALQQMEVLKKSIDQGLTTPATPPGNTFEVVVPADKPDLSPKQTTPGPKQAIKQKRLARRTGETNAATAPAGLSPQQQQQQLAAAQAQWKVILFHFKQAREASAQFRAANDPSMKSYFLKEAEAGLRRARAMAGKLKRTMAGKTALDAPTSAAALNREPIKFGEGTAIGQARRLAGQANGNKTKPPNLIDGSEGLRSTPPPGGVKPKTQGLLGTRPSPEATPVQ